MVNVLSLISAGSGGLSVGDLTYSLFPLSAPDYLPLNDDTASYLTSSYPELGAIYAPTTVGYSTAAKTIPRASTAFNFLFGNGIHIGWNSKGDIITSSDGTTWSNHGINTNYFTNTIVGPSNLVSNGVDGWNAMAYGKGRFVAIRPSPLTAFYTTYAGIEDGIGATAVSYDNGVTWCQGRIQNWVYTDTYQYPLSTNWQSIGFGNNLFVAIGYHYNQYNGVTNVLFSYSPDGINWAFPTYLTQTDGAGPFRAAPYIAYGPIGFASIATNPNYITSTGWYSTNGVNWGSFGLPVAQFWSSVAYGNGVYVAVGGGATSPYNTTSAASSTNLSTWTARTMPASLRWVSVAFSNGYFVAVGQNGSGTSTTSAIATSTDGITWTLQTTTAASTRGLVGGGNGRFIYQNEPNQTASNAATQVSISAAASSFTLPMPPAMRGATAYIKAT